VEIYEYQPQILHTKLVVIDRAVYLGSANMDIRSLQLNYELMLRFEDEAVAATARSHLTVISNTARIERAAWQITRVLATARIGLGLFSSGAVDPYVALKQFTRWRRVEGQWASAMM